MGAQAWQWEQDSFGRGKAWGMALGRKKPVWLEAGRAEPLGMNSRGRGTGVIKGLREVQAGSLRAAKTHCKG